MTYEEYLKKYIKDNQKVVDEQKGILDEQATATRDNINASADKSITDIEDAYKSETYNANEAAEIAHRRNEMQRILNERHLERKAAEIGLTDSGKNLTQLTANQLSYGNQSAEINNSRQKTVDTLAAAMASKVADVNIDRNARLSEVDTNLASAKNQIDSTLQSSAEKYASDMYKTDLENASKYKYSYVDNNGNVYGYTADDRKAEWNSLVNAFDANAVTSKDSAASMIYDFMSKFDLSPSEEALLVSKAGMTMGEWDQYVYNVTKPLDADNGWSAHQSIYRDGAQKDSYQLSPNYITPDTWDYKLAGTQNYTILIDNATWNGGGKNSIDHNDKVTIIAPNGDVIYKNKKIGDLDFSNNVKQAITNVTAGAKDGDQKVLKYDLNHK